MANFQVTCQPTNHELLWLQGSHNHRSYAVFHGEIPNNEILTVRRCDGRFWAHIRDNFGGSIPENVFQHIRNAGLGGVINCGYRRVDNGLITALVERWRPETHTFHLPVGEATVTLEDVQVLWGLPINAPLVSGTWYTRKKSQWIERCQELLGFQINPEHIEGGAVRISSLVEHLDDPAPQNDVQCQQRARIYILALLGGMLFADLSQKTVPLNYVESLADLSIAGRKSWGSAVLANLYRNLCDAASDATVKGIGGSLVLLQYWAWIRMPCIAPEIQVGNDEPYNFGVPYAARWNYKLSSKKNPAHVLVPYRSQLTALMSGQFIWRPYENVYHLLPHECREDEHIWKYQGFIIHWATVEKHQPDRVARQFGLIQEIPSTDELMSAEFHQRMHNINRVGLRNPNWIQRLQDPYVDCWLNRENSIFIGQQMTLNQTTAPGYMQWYHDRTVLCMTNPGEELNANQYTEWGARHQLFVCNFILFFF